MTISNIKESPIKGLTGLGGGATGLLQTGAAPVIPVSDLFSIDLVNGTGAVQTVNNGIDLSGEGGMVWSKARGQATAHAIHDTVRGVNKKLSTDTTGAEGDISGTTSGHTISSFNNNGFTLGADGTYGITNYQYTNPSYVHWTFRKAAKFFDIVTYDGNGTNQTVSHNLGCAPGMIIVKRTNASGSWAVWNKGLTNTTTYWIKLEEGEDEESSTDIWNSTAPTSTQFTVGDYSAVNADGGEYVAYLFAADEDNIKCNTTPAVAGFTEETIQLGWKPQFLLVKNITNNGFWLIADEERGLYTSTSSPSGAPGLFPDTNDDEDSSTDSVAVHDNGFIIKDWQGSSNKYLYMAIKEEE